MFVQKLLCCPPSTKFGQNSNIPLFHSTVTMSFSNAVLFFSPINSSLTMEIFAHCNSRAVDGRTQL